MSTRFIKYDLGQLRGREIVTVAVRERANVRLIGASNLRLFQRGQRYRYIGGQPLRSPIQLEVPGADHWYVALDLGGVSGTIHSNVSLST